MTSSRSITTIRGPGIAVRGNDIDTDRIIPARYLREITFDTLGAHAFEDERQHARGQHPFDDPRLRGAKVLVVNRNFGSGSSREHAPQALHRWGIDAIVGESFAEIFFGNCVAIGVPCLTLAAAQIEVLQSLVEEDPATALTVDLATGRVTAGDLSFAASLPDSVRHSFLSGDWDALAVLAANPDEVQATAARLPYLTGFRFPRPPGDG